MPSAVIIRSSEEALVDQPYEGVNDFGIELRPADFLDNAESVNQYKIGEVGGQLITLYVTDDKELKVFSE